MGQNDPSRKLCAFPSSLPKEDYWWVVVFWNGVHSQSKGVEDKGKMGEKVFSVVATEQQLYWS